MSMQIFEVVKNGQRREKISAHVSAKKLESSCADLFVSEYDAPEYDGLIQSTT